MISIVIGGLLVFIWGNYGRRLLVYKNFLYDMGTGLENSIKGKVVAISNEQSFKDYMEFYPVMILSDDSGKDDQPRLIYYDIEKAPIPFKIGDHVEFSMFGNYIKNIIEN